MNTRTRTLGTVSVLLASTLLAACASPGARRDKMIRRNLTPELETLYQRDADVKNQLAITFNENGRMIKQDFIRAFYLDRPSRLTREPIPLP